MRITTRQAIAFRLARHHLDARAPARNLVAVASDVCGIQAQLMSAAYIALWARIEHLAPEAIEDSIARKRTLVKTWAMRGTVHLLAATDLMAYLGGLLRGGLRSHDQWLARKGIGRRSIEDLITAIGRLLGHGPLTRKELAEKVHTELGRQAAVFVAHPWGDVVKRACARGVACFGPPRGGEITFVRLDRWLPAAHRRKRPADEAEETLLRRYLRAFAPATPADFAYWAGIQVGEARPIFERIKHEVVEVDVDGRPGLILQEDVPILQRVKSGPSVRLLPNFDGFLLGHKDKSHVVDDVHYKRVFRKAGWISQTVLVHGRVAGTWAHRREGRRLVVRVEPFQRLSKTTLEVLGGEVRSLAQFLGQSGAELQVDGLTRP